MTHPDHYEHLDSRERGVYTYRFLIAAINDDKNAHNLTCDELERRIRGCTIRAGELFASQAMFMAGILKVIDNHCGLAGDSTVPTMERTLAGLLDAAGHDHYARR